AIQLQVLSEEKAAEEVLLTLYSDSVQGKIQVQEDQADIRILLGILNSSRKNYDNAMDYFNQALAIKSTNAAPYYNIAVILFMEGKFREAVNYFKKAAELKPLFYSAKLHEGYSLLKQARYREAFHALNESIRYNPNHRESIILASYCAFKDSDPDTAYRLLSGLINIDPFYSSKVFVPLYLLRLEIPEDESIRYVSQILEKLDNGKKALIKQVLYMLYFVKGDAETAYENLSRYARKNKNAFTYSLLGMIAFHQDKYVDARSNLSMALKLDYSNGIAHLYAGRLAYDAGDWNQAFNHFVKAQTGDERKCLYAQTLQGDILLKYNKNTEALLLWKKVLSVDPMYIPAWERLLNLKE
ncbi:MAG: tetratricopeptide repeat protein, partial [Oligoflexia bacterium]|nr:tetratricopeptide repeat protein [Oligoflexia bacterium]